MTSIRDQQRALPLIVWAILLLGCRKDRDNTPPSITVLTPTEGTTIQVPQTFQVRVQVSDERTVEHVSFLLLDADQTPIASDGVQVGTASAEVQRYLSVEDERLYSGPITLVVRASDGSSERKAFVSMQLIAAPLRLRALFAAGGAGPIEVYRVDSTYQTSGWTTLAQDLGGMVVSSNDHRLVIAGSLNGPITGMDVNTGTMAWQIPGPGGAPMTWITDLAIAPDGRILVSTADNKVRVRYAPSGNVALTVDAEPGSAPLHTAIIDDGLICDEVDLGNGTHRLVRYQGSSGALINSVPCDLLVRHFVPLNNGQMLVIGDRDGDVVVQVRQTDLSGHWEPRVFPGTALSGVTDIAEGVVVLALSNGLVRYSLSDNSAVTIASDIAATSLCYDPVSGEVLALEAQTITRLDPLTGTVTGTITLPGPVGSIVPLFNRQP
ncbi:MAG: hypothetical protein H6594_06670 [Flavobacteriales bacterium]|nr:hypothetical protein [Flavobacteriales bacterium]